MPSNLHASQVTSSTPLVTTAETVLATLTTFTTNNPSGQGVVISYIANITTGTNTTQLAFRVRQGGITGTVVANVQTMTVTGGNLYVVSSEVLDATNTVSSVTYVLTVVQTGATANGSCTYAMITAEDANQFE